jgi:Flp pilus assembly protein TadD
LETVRDQQVGNESKTRFVEQIDAYLRSSDYSRALDLSRSAAAEFPNDAELSALEARAHDGVNRKAEADRLITESQELFAHGKTAEAIQVLRKAYELDKSNSLARAILANALVEHAQSVVDSDWLKAETLTNQALALNPAHPTAKTILNLIVRKKETSPVDDWVTQARKLQSSGDLFAALAWVAEGLAVHPHDPKLLQIQDAIQKDQDARRRQARRGDLDELRRLQREIDGASDVAAKQALADRIQAVAAKHWTDGEILSIANALLLRLGLVSQESSSPSPRGKASTLILHVPRPGAARPAVAETSQIPPKPVQPSQAKPRQSQASQSPPSQVAPSQVAPSQVAPIQAPTNEDAVMPPTVESQAPLRAAVPAVAPEEPPTAAAAPPSDPAASKAPPTQAPQIKVPPSTVPLRKPVRGKPRTAPPEPQVPVAQPATVAVAKAQEAPAKVRTSRSRAKQTATSSSTPLILVASAAAMILVAAIFFLAQKHQAPTVVTSSTTVSAPTASEPTAATPTVSAPEVAAPAPPTPEPAQLAPTVPSNTASGNIPPAAVPDSTPPVASVPNGGTLVLVVGQDGARVALNGKLLRQVTQGGQLRLPNLEPKDYAVQISKAGFQDPPQQKIQIRQGEEVRLIFSLQPQPKPQPSLASLTIQGGAPGTIVLIDQAQAGTIQADGTLSVSTLSPGDHTVELRRERFKPRQMKKQFVAGQTISLVAADVALEAMPGQLKVTFTPADAKVAVVKGDQLTVVTSGVPLSLAPGTYTLTARTADKFTRASTFEVAAGQSKNLDLFLAPNGMSKWEDPGAWKPEKDSFSRKGGDFVLYSAVPSSGTFSFSAMITKGRLLQWVFDYTDSRNYVLFQLDENFFYRAVIRNGQKTDEIKIADKGDKKSFRMLNIRVSPTEISHQIKHGNSWIVVDRWTQSGTNLSSGKFGFYIPGDDQVAVSGFAHYADLNVH